MTLHLLQYGPMNFLEMEMVPLEQGFVGIGLRLKTLPSSETLEQVSGINSIFVVSKIEHVAKFMFNTNLITYHNLFPRWCFIT